MKDRQITRLIIAGCVAAAVFAGLSVHKAFGFSPPDLPNVSRTCVKVTAERAYQYLHKNGFPVQRAVVKQWSGTHEAGAFAVQYPGVWIIGVDPTYRMLMCDAYNWSRLSAADKRFYSLDTSGYGVMFHEYFHQYGGAEAHGLVEGVAWDLERKWRRERGLGEPELVWESYVPQVRAVRIASAKATGTHWKSGASTRWRINELRKLGLH